MTVIDKINMAANLTSHLYGNFSLISNMTSDNNTYTKGDVILIVLFLLILILGTIGNAFVFNYFYLKKRNKRSIPELLFCYLSIVDIIASICNPALYIFWTITRYKWYLGYWSCKILVPLGSIATTMSSGLFIIVAFDRQRSIIHPFKSHYKLKHINMGVFLAFSCSILSNVHYAYNLTVTENSKCVVYDVRAKEFSVPSILYFFLQDYALIIIFVMTNCRIFRQINDKAAANLLGDHWDRRKRANGRIIRLLSTMAVVYFTLTIPRDTFHIVHIISWMDGDGIPVTKTILTINSFLKLMHTANSCVNVFIYFTLHRRFKIYILRFFGSIKEYKSIFIYFSVFYMLYSLTILTIFGTPITFDNYPF